MKILPILFFALLGVTAVPASAILDKSADDCTRQYGRPIVAAWTSGTPKPDPPARTRYDYRWRGIEITARFAGRDVANSRCASLTYKKSGEPSISPQLTAAEMDTLLALNSGGSSWERAPGGWKRKDNRAFAMDRRFTYHDAGRNIDVLVQHLYVFATTFDPKSAAEIMAGSSPK